MMYVVFSAFDMPIIVTDDLEIAEAQAYQTSGYIESFPKNF